MNFIVNRGERATVTGQTGSGKSVLSRELCLASASLYKAVYVLDPKNECKYLSSELSKRGVKVVHWVPPIDKVTDWARFNDFYRSAFSLGNSLVYIDECTMSIENAENPPYARALYQQGRARGVSVINCTQRPHRVPLYCYSEADYLYTFRLNLKADILRIGEIDYNFDPDELKRYECRFYDAHEQTSQIIKIGETK